MSEVPELDRPSWMIGSPVTSSPNRRWFTFSLRTLFVLVTVLACWLGWNVHIVRQRQAHLAEIAAEREARDKIWFEKLAGYGGSVSEDHKTVQRGPATPAKLPLIRRLLGDVARSRFERNREVDARLTMQFFPEATITYYVGTSGPEWVRAEVDRMYGRE
jgi:hypothetical protein